MPQPRSPSLSCYYKFFKTSERNQTSLPSIIWRCRLGRISIFLRFRQLPVSGSVESHSFVLLLYAPMARSQSQRELHESRWKCLQCLTDIRKPVFEGCVTPSDYRAVGNHSLSAHKGNFSPILHHVWIKCVYKLYGLDFSIRLRLVFGVPSNSETLLSPVRPQISHSSFPVMAGVNFFYVVGKRIAFILDKNRRKVTWSEFSPRIF